MNTANISAFFTNSKTELSKAFCLNCVFRKYGAIKRGQYPKMLVKPMVSSNNSIFGTEKFKIYKTMYTLGMGKSALFYMILFQIQLCQPKRLEMLYFHFFESAFQA